MRKSEIFDNFVKIAQDKGLVSEDAPAKAKKKLEQNPRWDSQDISTIEALYGVKPETAKGMDYKNNIMESAHPESVVISPAHDKINGLVENNIERQNILLHIVNKNVDGQVAYRKYAEKDLIMSLVSIGNVMDNKDYDQLRVLADTCLEQLSEKQIIKQAVGPMAIVAPVVGLLGVLYVQQHLDFIDEGYEKNHAKLIKEIDDLLNSNVFLGVGYEITQSLKNTLTDFKSRLEAFHNMFNQVKPIIEELRRPRTATELAQYAEDPMVRNALTAFQYMNKWVADMTPYLDQIKRNFESSSFKHESMGDEGFFTNVMEKAHLLGGKTSLVSDDFNDVVRAIDTYKKSIENMSATLKKAEEFKNNAQQELMSVKQQYGTEFGQSGTETQRPASHEEAVAESDKAILELLGG